MSSTSSSNGLKLPPEGSVSTLIVGDSNLRKIGKRRFDRSGQTHVLTLPGLTTNKLTSILDKQKTRSDVKHVICHVGTNDLSELKANNKALLDNYSLLIDSIKRAFPMATIGLTGLIPRKGIQLQTVLGMNKTIQSLCQRKGVTLIGDKTMFFSNTNSFPHYLFQGDKVHLNEKGVGVLVASMKRHLQMGIHDTRVNSNTKPVVNNHVSAHLSPIHPEEKSRKIPDCPISTAHDEVHLPPSSSKPTLENNATSQSEPRPSIERMDNVFHQDLSLNHIPPFHPSNLQSYFANMMKNSHMHPFFNHYQWPFHGFPPSPILGFPQPHPYYNSPFMTR